MEEPTKTMTICCVVLLATLFSTAGAAAKEAVVLYGGTQEPYLHLVSLGGEITPLGPARFRERVSAEVMDMPDGRFGLLWLERSGQTGIMLGRTATTDIDQRFPEPRWEGGRMRLADPVLDPAATRLAYLSGALWVQELNGLNAPKKVFEADGPLSSPSWSPDGSRIAFFHAEPWTEGEPYRYRLLVVHVDTGQVKELAPYSKSCGTWMDGTISPPAWRPNGKAIFFRATYEPEDVVKTRRGFIYAVSPEGGPVVKMTEGSQPMVHPDGDRLYCRRSARYPGGAGTVVYDLAKDTEVLREGLYLHKISPSGRYLACWQRPPDRSYSMTTEITLADKEGQVIKTIETGQSLGRVIGWTEE